MMKKSGKPMKKMPPSFPPAKAAPKYRPTFNTNTFENMKMESDNDGDEQKVKKPRKSKF